MSELRELYQEVILDHGKRPRNFKLPEGYNRHGDGFNPLCGDKLELGLIVEGDRIVDAEGVCIRTGHHCAQPVMERYGVPATARASLGMYNTRGDLDRLVQALHKVMELFG